MKHRLHPMALALLVLCTAAHGESFVYRCVQPDRPVSLQSTPCADGAKTASVTSFAREPEPAASTTAAHRHASASAASAPAARTVCSRRARVATTSNECHDVKAARDRWGCDSGL